MNLLSGVQEMKYIYSFDSRKKHPQISNDHFVSIELNKNRRFLIRQSYFIEKQLKKNIKRE